MREQQEAEPYLFLLIVREPVLGAEDRGQRALGSHWPNIPNQTPLTPVLVERGYKGNMMLSHAEACWQLRQVLS